MRKGAVISTLIAICSGIGLTIVFVNNSSPYVTIRDVDGKATKVHVVGKIVSHSLRQDPIAQTASFELRDDSGEMPVKYVGPAQSNLAAAKQVVVIGNKKDGVFEASQMLVKCPSKYESDQKPKR